METNKLFLQNYTNQGDCAELHRFTKTIEKEFKKTGQVKVIKYYPWAVVERIFRSQGGKVDVVNWSMKVELNGKDYVPNADGEIVLTDVVHNALFIHLKATWQGQEENEYYPIFDNQNAKIIKVPDALDLNTAKQRGMVRLIARISGIGLEIFEQQEGQFEEDKTEVQPQQVKVSKKQDTPKTVSRQDVQPSESNEFFQDFLNGQTTKAVEEVKITPTPIPTPVVETPTTFGSDTQEYADLLLEVRKIIRDKSAQAKAKEFLPTKGKELLSQLTYPELIELKGSL